MRHATLGFLAGLTAFALPSQAAAQNVVADPAIVAGAMQDAGLRAEIDHLSNGLPFIDSSISGFPFRVFFLGCSDGADCKWVQFWAAFKTGSPPSLEQMNAYARDNAWGKIYIDEQNDPAIEIDIDLEVGGMSQELFKDNLAYWDYALGKYAAFVRDSK